MINRHIGGRGRARPCKTSRCRGRVKLQKLGKLQIGRQLPDGRGVGKAVGENGSKGVSPAITVGPFV